MASPPDPFAGAENIYTVAVRGAMNPAIHHPAWYRFIGVIDADEMELATATQTPIGVAGSIQVQGNQGFSSAQFSVFTIGTLRITCLPGIWSVATTEGAKFERGIEMASRVFAALPHTPVSGYTISFAHHRHTPLQDVGAHIARLVRSLPLGILHAEATEDLAHIRYIARSAGRDILVDLQPSAKAKSMVFIGFNATHTIEPAKELKLFDLDPLLVEAAGRARKEAEEWVANMTEALS